MTNAQLKSLIQQRWGSLIRPDNDDPRFLISEAVDFSILSDENLICLLEIIQNATSPDRYGFSATADNFRLLRLIREKISKKANAKTCPQDRISPVLLCYDALVLEDMWQPGLYALATMYLIAEIEWCMKELCPYLTSDGYITRDLPMQLVRQLTKRDEKYKMKKKGKRVSQIEPLMLIYCYRNTNPFALYLKDIDASMKRYTKEVMRGRFNYVDGIKVKHPYQHTDVFKRINETRNSVMHGSESFLMSELHFYLNLHAILFLSNQGIY